MSPGSLPPFFRPRLPNISVWVAAGCFLAAALLSACQETHPIPPGPTTPAPAATASLASSPTSVPTRTIMPVERTASGKLPVWGNYAAPTMPAVTAIPPPLSGLTLPEDVRTLVLLGSDQDAPYEGRTQGIVLVFVNPRLAKASLVTIPGDLFVYIPGYTMQRISLAYTIGGLPMLFKTLEYNFGIRPEHWALVHPADFVSFVDVLDGLDVPVLVPIPDACGGFPAGRVHMDGARALCYISFRQGSDEIDRNRRLQQVLRLLFLRMVENGNLVRLPDIIADYQTVIRIDLTQDEILGYIPLALKLGDPQRVSYYQVGWDEVTFWQLPGQAKSSVLLPRPDALLALLQQAVDALAQPAPLSDRVATLVYELTISPTPSITPIPSQTPTITPTTHISSTPSNTPTISLTPTISTTPTISGTPTTTHTPTETVTPTP